jgi:2-keto-4-pentenoate hydratase/2-oxohepta-3-ene-1,7-dioic acid hydratase in catechol pathway
MRTKALVAVFVLLSAVRLSYAQTVGEPFKFGTFERDGATFLGLVLRDAYAVDLERANRDLERSPLVVKLPMARDMKELAGRYDLDLGERVHAIVDHVLADNRLIGPNHASYVYPLDAVTTLSPILYPNKILSTSGNYYQHLDEMEEFGFEESPKKGQIPYLFMKPPTTGVIGNGDPIPIPQGRTQIDWEVELGVVIGTPAKNIELEEAPNHIFGYTVMIDVSDRGDANSEGGELHRTEFGIDWLLGKAHDGHAPLGPFILPREFVRDPHELGLKLTVNGDVMQDSKGKYPSNVVFTANELVTHVASIMTLEPGDVIACGSPAGVGAGREPPVFLKSGDEVVATIENIGSLTHRMK